MGEILFFSIVILVFGLLSFPPPCGWIQWLKCFPRWNQSKQPPCRCKDYWK